MKTNYSYIFDALPIANTSKTNTSIVFEAIVFALSIFFVFIIL